MKGFVFPDIRRNGSEYTLTLRVNASAAIDNTNIQCEFDVSGSSERNWTTTAKILVITSEEFEANKLLCNNTLINLYSCMHFGITLTFRLRVNNTDS